jgi:hypothetical protein
MALFYGSKRYAETQDVRYAIAGKGPIVVDKMTGVTTPLGTAGGVEYQIARYRRTRVEESNS